MEYHLNFEQIIISGIQGLPEAHLKEIAEFVFFVRQKSLYPERFREEFANDLVQEELSLLDSKETNHLESEFDNYQEIYPKE